MSDNLGYNNFKKKRIAACGMVLAIGLVLALLFMFFMSNGVGFPGNLIGFFGVFILFVGIAVIVWYRGKVAEYKEMDRNGIDVSYTKRSEIFWRSVRISVYCFLLGLFLIGGAFTSSLGFANVGTHYGCPNSKRIGKLNLRKEFGI